MITSAFCRLKLLLLKEPHILEWLTEAEIEDDKKKIKRRSQEKNSLMVDSVLGSRKQSSHSRLFTRSPKVEESLFKKKRKKEITPFLPPRQFLLAARVHSVAEVI